MESKDFDIRSYLLGYVEGAERKNSKVKKTCHWTTDDPYSETYVSGCKYVHYFSGGNIIHFSDGNIIQNEFRFCPYCGNKIEQV